LELDAPLYSFVLASDLSENRCALFGPMRQAFVGKLCKNKESQAGIRWATELCPLNRRERNPAPMLGDGTHVAAA